MYIYNANNMLSHMFVLIIICKTSYNIDENYR